MPERKTPRRVTRERGPRDPVEGNRPRPGSSRRRAALVRTRERLSGVEAEPPGLDAERPVSPEADREASSSRPPARDPARRRREVWLSLIRPGRGQIIAAVLLGLVGMTAVMQIRINTADDTYTTARREDLIQLLDGLGVESRRLESEIADLERTRSSLQSGADTQRVAREDAVARESELAILAGTAPAEGPGIRMRIVDPQRKVDGTVLLDAVEEMRDAGAEVIEINDRLRVVGSSWFGTDARGLVVDGTPVARPVSIEVIGDPHSLEEAARFRGGIVSEITGPKIGGQVQIDQESRVVVTSLHPAPVPAYARPATPTPR